MNESTLDLAVKLLEDLKHSDFEEDNNLAYALKKWIEFELNRKKER